MQTKKGLTPLHLGFVIDNRLVAPPSQFALAYIGTRTATTLDAILNDVVDGIRKGKIDASDTPLLEYYSKQPDFSLETLRQMAIARYGTAKMIDTSSVNFIEGEGRGKEGKHLATLSQKEQANLVIETRQLRSTKNQPYPITIFNPFDLALLRFIGGSRLTRHHLEKGHHWSKGLRQEHEYLDTLALTARKQFENPIEVIDYYRACALIGLESLIRSGQTNYIGGSYSRDFDHVALPFDFSPKMEGDLDKKYKATKYALEVFLMRYAPPNIIKEAIGHDTGKVALREIDEHCLGKPIASRILEEHLKENWLTKGAMLDDRHFPSYSWAIIQAFEEHCFGLGRRFKGYSEEFIEIPGFMTTSIVFDMAPYSRRPHSNISVRIVYDDNFGLPFFLYKNFASPLRGIQALEGSPLDYTNMPLGVQRKKEAKWSEVDWRTGQRAVCTLREPNREILGRAEEISRRLGPGAYDLRGRYIAASRTRTQR